MVRGFWGDICNSPFIAYGIELETKEEHDHFYQNDTINYKFDEKVVTEFNLLKYLIRIQKDEVCIIL
jgi:hypothetical protein